MRRRTSAAMAPVQAAIAGGDGRRPARRRAAAAHLARGKLLPRERVERLLDPGSPFLEVGLLAAHGTVWR